MRLRFARRSTECNKRAASSIRSNCPMSPLCSPTTRTLTVSCSEAVVICQMLYMFEHAVLIQTEIKLSSANVTASELEAHSRRLR